MKYAKKWISIDDQVDLLTRGKGLGCNNVDDLKRSLENHRLLQALCILVPVQDLLGRRQDGLPRRHSPSTR